MSGLTEELKTFAQELGVSEIGIAPVERYSQAPTGHQPKDFLPGAKSVMTFSYELNHGPINRLPDSRKQYMNEFDAVNQILLNISHRISRFLEKKGYESIAFGPEAAIGDYSRLKGDLSHKHSAVLCGLGSFGINNLLLSSKHMARVRLATLISVAPMEYDQPLMVNYCKKCLKCVNSCPSRALENWENNYDPSMGWVIDKERCAHYIFVVNAGKRCGMCIKACPTKPSVK